MTEKAVLKEISRRFFLNNPVKIARQFTGQGITASNAYKLGMRAGPDVSVNNLLHEMGHLAERPKHIILQRPHFNWGFTYGKYWQVGHHEGYEPQTDQQVQCEARVWSFQVSLMREFGIEVDVPDLVRSAVFLPALCHYKYEAKIKLPYNEREKYSLEALAAQVERDTDKYSYTVFCRNWQDRMNTLKA